MAAPLSKIFGGILASEGTTGRGPEYYGGGLFDQLREGLSPWELQIQERQREIDALRRQARDGSPPLSDQTLRELFEVLQAREAGVGARKPKDRPEPPMPKLVEMRPKRQIQLED